LGERFEQLGCLGEFLIIFECRSKRVQRRNSDQLEWKDASAGEYSN